MSTAINSSLIETKNLPELKVFVLFSFLFLDFGILFGALNAFRMAGIFDVPQIHQTHWTSTLLGGITILMLGQILYFFSTVLGSKYKYHNLSIIVLVLWLIGITSSYMMAWTGEEIYLIIANYGFRIAAILYLVTILLFFSIPEFNENLKKNRSLYLLLTAVFWFIYSIFNFDIQYGSLSRIFLLSYVYGFFSLTLFGSLSFILPRLFKTKGRSKSSIIRDLLFLNLSAFFLSLHETFNLEHLSSPSITVLGILGIIFWALTDLFFILWIFDLVYKTGFYLSLGGQFIALVMFGFFVWDSFINITFPNWVHVNHFHFMFLGTLLITIFSIGFKLVNEEFSNQINQNKRFFEFIIKIRNIAIVFALLCVGGVLLSFTLGSYISAGIFGILLFTGIIVLTSTVLIAYKTSRNFR